MSSKEVEELVENMEDPGVSWIDLVLAVKDENRARGEARVRELLAVALASHWTHTLWDRVVFELETPEVEFVDQWDSEDEAAVPDAVAHWLSDKTASSAGVDWNDLIGSQ